MHCSCVSTVYLIIVKHFWHCLVICTKFHSLVWFQEERLLNTYMLITRSTVTLKDVLLGLELTDLSFSPWVILVFLLTVFLKNFCWCEKFFFHVKSLFGWIFLLLIEDLELYIEILKFFWVLVNTCLQFHCKLLTFLLRIYK